MRFTTLAGKFDAVSRCHQFSYVCIILLVVLPHNAMLVVIHISKIVRKANEKHDLKAKNDVIDVTITSIIRKTVWPPN